VNGEIAQLISLTCYANAYLKQSGQKEISFGSNSTWRVCKSISFVEQKNRLLLKPKQVRIAKTPDEWFRLLKRNGAISLRLLRPSHIDSALPEYMLAGFSGVGNAWRIQVLYPHNLCQHWISNWELKKLDATENRIWQITYGKIFEGAARKLAENSLSKSVESLKASLREIADFAQRNECAPFIELFSDALSMLNSGSHHNYSEAFAPKGFLSQNAELALSACENAWVFGGMGSWNDLGFEGKLQEEYEHTTARLFEAINETIVSATDPAGT
jgi:hypothetical protein